MKIYDWGEIKSHSFIQAIVWTSIHTITISSHPNTKIIVFQLRDEEMKIMVDSRISNEMGYIYECIKPNKLFSVSHKIGIYISSLCLRVLWTKTLSWRSWHWGYVWLNIQWPSGRFYRVISVFAWKSVTQSNSAEFSML